MSDATLPTIPPPPRRPFRRAVLRGLGIILPPLLTVVIFIWAWNTIRLYVLDPSTQLTRDIWASRIEEVRTDLSGEYPTVDGRRYTRLNDGSYVPTDVEEFIRAASHGRLPPSGEEVYRRYVELKYLQPHVVVPVFLLVFVLSMYLLGQFVAAGIGRFFWSLIEGFIQRLPLVRNVYSSVKQVTDFMFSEQEVQFSRVVALEFPRKGTWCIGLVTGVGPPELQAALGEPLLTILVPYSPLPVTGATVVVAKSETIDLSMTIDQAVQFIVSCGVVVPAKQVEKLRAGRKG
ncbi:MAG: DUF502 domain-containing protein [Pirellulales bacterium]